jgi:hypothetical protein
MPKLGSKNNDLFESTKLIKLVLMKKTWVNQKKFSAIKTKNNNKIDSSV